MPWESYAVFSGFFSKQEAMRYWRQQGAYLLLGILLAGGTCIATRALPLDGFPGLFAKAAFAALLSGAVLLLLFRQDLIDLKNTLLHRKT